MGQERMTYKLAQPGIRLLESYIRLEHNTLCTDSLGLCGHRGACECLGCCEKQSVLSSCFLHVLSSLNESSTNSRTKWENDNHTYNRTQHLQSSC